MGNIARVMERKNMHPKIGEMTSKSYLDRALELGYKQGDFDTLAEGLLNMSVWHLDQALVEVEEDKNLLRRIISGVSDVFSPSSHWPNWLQALELLSEAYEKYKGTSNIWGLGQVAATVASTNVRCKSKGRVAPPELNDLGLQAIEEVMGELIREPVGERLRSVLVSICCSAALLDPERAFWVEFILLELSGLDASIVMQLAYVLKWVNRDLADPIDEVMANQPGWVRGGTALCSSEVQEVHPDGINETLCYGTYHFRSK